MKNLLLVALLCSAVPVYADGGIEDAGVDEILDGGIDGGTDVVVISSDPVVTPLLPDGGMADGGTMNMKEFIDHPLSLKNFYQACKEGNGWLAAAILLFSVVGLIRMFGKRLHDWIPDDSLWDKPLFFIYDTKIGGWLLNWLTAIVGCIGGAAAAGVPVDVDCWKVALLASTTGTALIELKDDVVAWVKQKNKDVAPEAKPTPKVT